MTVINSRTRGLAPMMMGNLSDEDSNHHASIDESVESEDGQLYRSEIRNGKKVFTKEEGRVKLTENDSAVDALVTSEQIAEPKLTSMGDPQNLRLKGKVLEIARTKKTKTSQNVPWRTIDVGSFEVLSDHGDEVDGDESRCEATEMMTPLPPGSWFKRTDVLREVSEALQ